MGKIRYLIYGALLIGIFAVIHYFFPQGWSRWIQHTNEMFAGTRIDHLGLFILGCFFFFAFILFYGIDFLASFGGADYPKGSESFTPPVSVLIPAKDEEKVIGNTLESFTEADYPKNNLEIVVIASDSTDKTAEICEKYQDRLNITVLTDPLPKKGKPAALNYGLKHTSHDLICVYDADTFVRKETLQSIVRHL